MSSIDPELVADTFTGGILTMTNAGITGIAADSIDYTHTDGSYFSSILVGDPDTWTLTTALHYGGTLTASAAGSDDLNAVAEGMSVTLKADDEIVATFGIDASDTIVRNGVSLSVGNGLISDGTAGTYSIATCQYRAANTWECDCSDGMTEEP